MCPITHPSATNEPNKLTFSPDKAGTDHKKHDGPNEQTSISECETSKYPIYELVLQCMVIISNAMSKAYNDLHQTTLKKKSPLSPRWYTIYPFPHLKISRLRFGCHGIFGALSLALTSLAASDSQYYVTNKTFVSCILFSSTATAIGSLHLISQVPVSSNVAKYIVPPHRDAFRRTIGTVLYLNLRLYRAVYCASLTTFLQTNVLSDGVWAALLILFCVYNFVPFGPVDWKNGNTWIFILPMSVGLFLDAVHQLPALPKYAQWNRDVVDPSALLSILWHGLWIAFLFTLAFRKFVSIKVCYWIAAADVGLICARLGIKALAVYNIVSV